MEKEGEPYHFTPACDPADVICNGSDAEDSPAEILAKRSRYEQQARRIASGHLPILLTTRLKGPFDRKSGWENPWGYQRKTQRKTQSERVQRGHKTGKDRSLGSSIGITSGDNTKKAYQDKQRLAAAVEPQAEFNTEPSRSSIEHDFTADVTSLYKRHFDTGREYPQDASPARMSHTHHKTASSRPAMHVGSKMVDKSRDGLWLKRHSATSRVIWDERSAESPTSRIIKRRRRRTKSPSPVTPSLEPHLSHSSEDPAKFSNHSQWHSLVGSKSAKTVLGQIHNSSRTGVPSDRFAGSPKAKSHRKRQMSVLTEESSQQSISRKKLSNSNTDVVPNTASQNQHHPNRATPSSRSENQLPSNARRRNPEVHDAHEIDKNKHVHQSNAGGGDESQAADKQLSISNSFVTEVAPSCRDLEKFTFRKRRRMHGLHIIKDELDPPIDSPESTGLQNIAEQDNTSCAVNRNVDMFSKPRTDGVTGPLSDTSEANWETTLFGESYHWDQDSQCSDKADIRDVGGSPIPIACMQEDHAQDLANEEDWETTVGEVTRYPASSVETSNLFEKTPGDAPFDVVPRGSLLQGVEPMPEFSDQQQFIDEEDTAVCLILSSNGIEPVMLELASVSTNAGTPVSQHNDSAAQRPPGVQNTYHSAVKKTADGNSKVQCASTSASQSSVGAIPMENVIDQNDVSTQSANTTPHRSNSILAGAAAGEELAELPNTKDAKDLVGLTDNRERVRLSYSSQESHDVTTSSLKTSVTPTHIERGSDVVLGSVPSGEGDIRSLDEVSLNISLRSPEVKIHRTPTSQSVATPEPSAESISQRQAMRKQSPWCPEKTPVVSTRAQNHVRNKLEEINSISSGVGNTDSLLSEFSQEGSPVDWHLFKTHVLGNQGSKLPLVNPSISLKAPEAESPSKIQSSYHHDLVEKNPWAGSSQRELTSKKEKKKVSFGIALAHNENDIEDTTSLAVSSPVHKSTPTSEDWIGGEIAQTKKTALFRKNEIIDQTMAPRVFKRILPDKSASQLDSSPAPVDAMAEAFVFADRDVGFTQVNKRRDGYSVSGERPRTQFGGGRSSFLTSGVSNLDGNLSDSPSLGGFDVDDAILEANDFLEDWSVELELSRARELEAR